MWMVATYLQDREHRNNAGTKGPRHTIQELKDLADGFPRRNNEES